MRAGIIIDRPKGFQKKFKTPAGEELITYPLAYGYFSDITNPEDEGGADIFLGTSPVNGICGYFIKSNKKLGKVEHKWFADLTQQELIDLFLFCTRRQLYIDTFKLLDNFDNLKAHVKEVCSRVLIGSK